jgi:hypothetical protein
MNERGSEGHEKLSAALASFGLYVVAALQKGILQREEIAKIIDACFSADPPPATPPGGSDAQVAHAQHLSHVTYAILRCKAGGASTAELLAALQKICTPSAVDVPSPGSTPAPLTQQVSAAVQETLQVEPRAREVGGAWRTTPPPGARLPSTDPPQAVS